MQLTALLGAVKNTVELTAKSAWKDNPWPIQYKLPPILIQF